MPQENIIKTEENEENIAIEIDFASKKEKQDSYDELKDFIMALDEKAEMAGQRQLDSIKAILESIRDDMQKWLLQYEKCHISFEEAYEEITSLYVFTEMYIKIDS